MPTLTGMCRLDMLLSHPRIEGNNMMEVGTGACDLELSITYSPEELQWVGFQVAACWWLLVARGQCCHVYSYCLVGIPSLQNDLGLVSHMQAAHIGVFCLFVFISM